MQFPFLKNQQYYISDIQHGKYSKTSDPLWTETGRLSHCSTLSSIQRVQLRVQVLVTSDNNYVPSLSL